MTVFRALRPIHYTFVSNTFFTTIDIAKNPVFHSNANHLKMSVVLWKQMTNISKIKLNSRPCEELDVLHPT